MNKIDIIEISNFQSHKNSTLELDTGVNIITGASDKGKSAIMRALKWVFRNRPRGFAFRSNFADEEDITRVAVGFDDEQFVVRERKSGLNRYLTPERDENDPIDAMGTDAPKEVLDIVNIDDYCFRSQHDSYFLLQDTSGGVGRTLNDIVGLSVIDEVRKDINKIINSANSGLENAVAEEKRLKEELDFFSNLDDIKKDVDKLGTKLKERDVLREERTELYKICKDLQQIEDGIEQLNLWLKIEKEAGEIFVLLDQHNSDVREKGGIQSILDDIKEIDSDISDIDFDLEYFDKISETSESISQLKRDIILIDDVKDIVVSINTLDNEIPYCDEKIKHIDGQIAEIGICPYCGSELSKDHECEK